MMMKACNGRTSLDLLRRPSKREVISVEIAEAGVIDKNENVNVSSLCESGEDQFEEYGRRETVAIN